MDAVDVEGLRISYDRRGDGPPLLLLHGSPGDSRTWSPQLEALADEFTVIAWDMPGTGGSDDPPESFTLSDYADCAAAFAEAIGVDRAHVVGLSFGGGLALELYRRHAQLVRSLVLVGAYAGWAGSLPATEVERRLQMYRRLSAMTPEQMVDELLPTMFTPTTPKQSVDAFGAAILGTHPAGLRISAGAFAAVDLRDVLSTVRVPTLLVYGEQDVRAPLDVARALHADIPGSKLVVVDGAGHIVNIEAAQRFNAEVRAFLRTVSDDKERAR